MFDIFKTNRQKLHQYVLEKDFEKIKILLLQLKSKDLDSLDGRGYPPLAQAVSLGDERIISLLLEAGANPNIRNSDGRPAIFFSSSISEHILKRFLDAGLNPNIVNETTSYGGNGYASLIFYFASEGRGDLVKLLLESGANPDIKNRFEESALTAAASKGNLDIVQVLLNHSAGVDVSGKQRSPLSVAIKSGNMLCAEEIKKRMTVTDLSKALIEASSDFNFKLMSYLIESGADVSFVDEFGSALHRCSGYLMDEFRPISKETITSALALLLSSGCNVNICDSQGRTALMSAVKSKNIVALSFLLKNGASLDMLDKKGRNALFYAADSFSMSPGEKKRMIDFLTRNGSDGSIVDSDGKRFTDLL